MRRHAALRLRLGEREDRITRATKLEGPDLLKIFALAEQVGSDELIQAGAGEHRRTVRIRFNACSGSLHICKGRIRYHMLSAVSLPILRSLCPYTHNPSYGFAADIIQHSLARAYGVGSQAPREALQSLLCYRSTGAMCDTCFSRNMTLWRRLQTRHPSISPPCCGSIRRRKRRIRTPSCCSGSAISTRCLTRTPRCGSRLLELVLTSREIGKGQRVPMCGVPVHAVETYIARLIKAGCKVAVCEQMEDPRLVRGLVRREVIRVITPGTVVEEAMLEEAANNFLVAICEAEEAFGLAALDVSTGEFFATTLEGATALDTLQAELVRLQPAECLVSQAWAEHERWQPLAESLRLHCTVCADEAFDLLLARQHLAQHLAPETLQREAHTPLALRAAGAIVQYAQATHHMVLPHLTTLRSYRLAHYMVLDAVTRRNLELVRTIRHGDRHGSVLEVLDETTTAMGARLLRRWLEQPLLQLDTINARLDAVAELAADTARRQRLRQALRSIYDIERLLGRVACGTANARQLTALRCSLAGLAALRQALEGRPGAAAMRAPRRL